MKEKITWISFKIYSIIGLALLLASTFMFVPMDSKGSSYLPNESDIRDTLALDKEVSGKVTDSTGSPLPGVSIHVKNNNSIGTTTDLNGRFVLEVPDNSTIVFSMVGFIEQEVPVLNKDKINIVLQPSFNTLGEVVVVAFGKQKKEEVVGAVTTINPKDLKVPSSNLTTALAGKIAGMIAYQRSGEPGEDNANFFIRGVTTFGYKKDPLILVDGIELSTRDLARLQVDDIENFSILKDATATALYGARGANGIILITTKEGKEGKAKVDLRIENSMSAPTSSVEVADPITYMKLNNEAVLTRDPLGELPYSPQKIDNTIAGTNPFVYPTNDWRDILFKKNTMNQRANLNVTGGGKVARYYLSGTFNQDNGVLKVNKKNNFNNNIDLKTYGFRSNVNINLTKSTEVGIKIYDTFDDYTGPIGGGSHYYRVAMRSDPVSFPAYFPTDSIHRYTQHILFGNTDDQLSNPYAEMVKGYNEYNQTLVLGQFQFKQDLSFLTKGLKFQGLFNATRYSFYSINRAYQPYWYQVGSYDKYNDSYILSSINENSGTEYLDYDENEKIITSTTYIQTILNYSRTFADKHEVSGLLVFLLQNQQDGNAGSLVNSLQHRNTGLSGRFTYSYDNKYFAELDFGYNGSERFSENNRFGFFPSAGFAWYVSKENFWQSIKPVISSLKLRGTYGVIGNDAIGSASDRFYYLSDVNMNDGGKKAIFGINNKESLNGVTVNRYSNPEITWETSYKGNIGMDLTLYRNINIVVDLWKEHRTHILMTRTDIPPAMGLSPSAIPKANIGEAEGSGLDFSVDYSHSFNNGFWLQGRANFTYASSRFLVYEEPEYKDAPWKSRVGYPIDQTWGYIADRLFVDNKEVQNSPTQNFGGQEVLGGDIKYRDVNKDGEITSLDMVPLGYPTTPEIVYGFGLSVGYKNFDLSAFFQGLARESFWIDVGAANGGTAPFVVSGAYKNQILKAYANNHWSEDNRDIYALWPRLSPDLNSNNNQTSTWFMRDGTFLRLKNAEIGYTLPLDLTKRIHIDKVRFYANGTNLFLWSKFDLWDVEMAGQGMNYPVQRVINLGIQVSF